MKGKWLKAQGNACHAKVLSAFCSRRISPTRPTCVTMKEMQTQ